MFRSSHGLSGWTRDFVGDFNKGKLSALKLHSNRPIKLFQDEEALTFDRQARFLDSKGAILPADGVIFGDMATLFDAKDIFEAEVFGDGAMEVTLIQRDLTELSVKSWQIALKKVIGCLLGADLRQTHLFDEAILEGFEDTLNPSLGLRRAGIDELDA